MARGPRRAGNYKKNFMSAEKKAIPRLFSPKNPESLSPRQLKVTGSKLELAPANRIPATPLSASYVRSTPWQRSSPSHTESKELLLSVHEDLSHQKKLEASKGWTVTVSAARQLYDGSDIGAPVQNLSVPQVPRLEKMPVSSARSTASIISMPPSVSAKAQVSNHSVPRKSSHRSQPKLVRSGTEEKKGGSFGERNEKDCSRERRGQERVHTQKPRGRYRRLNSRGNMRTEERHKKESKRSGYLEKKYGLLWSHKVFGRVLPWQASQHHTATVKRKVLVAWQEIWWVQRKEWKLNIRAECHNRYRCWIMVWKAWSKYVATCQEKKRKMQRSDRLFSKLLLRRVWQGWQLYLQRTREKKERVEFCRMWHVEWVQRRHWLQWRCALSLRVQGQAMELIALHHWATTLEGQVFIQWKRAHRAQRTAANQLARANKRLKQAVAQAWWTYVLIRRNKLYLRRVAVGSHNSTLLSKCFSRWTARLTRSRELAQFQGLINHKSRLAICRRAMANWKFFVTLRRHMAELVDLAGQHYTLALKTRVLGAFRGHMLLQRKVDLYKQQARAFHDQCRLQQCWGVWLQRCENNEEIALGPLTRRARHHAASKLSHKVLTAWIQYVIQQRYKKRLKLAADTHFKNTALPKCLQGFRENVLICRYKRELRESSDDLRRETLLSMGFYKWWREAQLSRDLRMLERVAILHWEEVAKRHWLHHWKNCYRKRLVHCEQEEMAGVHWVQRLLRGAFKRWVGQSQHRTSSCRQLQLAARHDAVKLERKAWSAWRMHVVRQRDKHAQREVADGHYELCILRKVLASWKVYHGEALVKASKERAASQLYRGWLLRLAVNQWREEVRERSYGRQLHHTATQHHTQWTLLKHLRGWRELTEKSKQEREREDMVVLEARAHLLKMRARQVLHTWRVHVVSMERERQGMARAQLHHQRHLKHKLLSAWQSYRHTRHRKALLSTHSQQFHDTRLLCGCYAIWKCELMRALENKQKSVVALWHWSHVLEHKVLQAWLAHTRERRRKEERYACAMDRHRQRLLEKGVRQWIRVATYRMAQREQQALNIQAKNTEKVFGCVRRCADHWRALTKRHRPPQSLVPPHLAPPSSDSTLHKSTKFWSSLAKQLNLPDGSCVRPQPRRPAPSCTSFSEALPRLLPPPSPQVPGLGEVGGARLVGTGSLDVTAEPSTDPTVSQTSLAAAQDPLQPHQPLPPSHPLMDRSIHEEVLSMRQQLRNYLQLKIHQKALLDELAGSRLEEEERLQVQAELAELEEVIVDTQPVVKEVATKIDKLLQLCFYLFSKQSKTNANF